MIIFFNDFYFKNFCHSSQKKNNLYTSNFANILPYLCSTVETKRDHKNIDNYFKIVLPKCRTQIIMKICLFIFWFLFA